MFYKIREFIRIFYINKYSLYKNVSFLYSDTASITLKGVFPHHSLNMYSLYYGIYIYSPLIYTHLKGFFFDRPAIINSIDIQKIAPGSHHIRNKPLNKN